RRIDSSGLARNVMRVSGPMGYVNFDITEAPARGKGRKGNDGETSVSRYGSGRPPVHGGQGKPAGGVRPPTGGAWGGESRSPSRADGPTVDGLGSIRRAEVRPAPSR